MTDAFSVSDVFIHAATPLTPRNAVAAIILDERERVLLQLRDERDDIFFPHHWGCFGGAIEPEETPQHTLVRELEEEIGVTFEAGAIERFIHIAFQPKGNAPRDVERHFFLVRTRADVVASIRLGEGSAFRFFAYEEVMRLPNVTPYDKFALWIYFNQGRIQTPP